MGDPKVIFEDEQLLVLDKPSGMVVNRAETVGGTTVQDWAEERPSCQALKKSSKKDSDFFRRSGIVHRLDKETSGLLLVAKTPQAFADLQKQFKERRVEKRYLTLVHGQVMPKEGIIQASISRSHFDRQKFGVFLGGREAETKYKAISNWSLVISSEKEKFSLLEIMPKTGRTHQIRVHLRHIGHSVVGDQKYAGRKTARRDRQWCPRQFLHASFLAFTHPVTKKRVKFESDLPPDLKNALKKLESGV